ncbi:hypothetical protein PSEUDO8Z_100388 [Pseudomonas sp. 8Z]|nr:hypothetical protein PSEUDO8Z_100388 [Pseudomonas sp. 8Z]
MPLVTRAWGQARFLCSEFLDRLHLIFVDGGALAVELFELVEAGILVIGRLVHGLNLAAVGQGYNRWRGTARQSGEANGKKKGGNDPLSHGLSP